MHLDHFIGLSQYRLINIARDIFARLGLLRSVSVDPRPRDVERHIPTEPRPSDLKLLRAFCRMPPLIPPHGVGADASALHDQCHTAMDFGRRPDQG